MSDVALPGPVPATVPDPASAPPVRWGILGAGGIAGSFAAAVRGATRSQLVAVGSRDRVRGERFATAHGIPTTHVGYDDLVADDHVDVVYVATPHSEHRAHALLAIEAGKHLLVEKAFTRNAAEAREVFDAARAAGTFVMEAMWTRHLPHVAALRQVLASGVLGEIVGITADHGQRIDASQAARLHEPALAGGALLDLGVYPVAFAHDLLGAPSSVLAAGDLTPTGVDASVSVLLEHAGGARSTLSTTLRTTTPTVAVVAGTEGRVEVAGSFYAPSSFRVVLRDGATWQFEQPVAHGLAYEAAEVARCVTAGLTESPRMTWQDTLDVLGTLDEVRRQVGVVYPGE